MDTKNQVQEQIEMHLCIISELKNELSSQASKVGDWKFIKILEAQVSGKELPYDTTEIASFFERRNEIRKQINEHEESIRLLQNKGD